MKPSDREQRAFDQIKTIRRDPVAKENTRRAIESALENQATDHSNNESSRPFFIRYWPGLAMTALSMVILIAILPSITGNGPEGDPVTTPATQEEVPEMEDDPGNTPEMRRDNTPAGGVHPDVQLFLDETDDFLDQLSRLNEEQQEEVLQLLKDELSNEQLLDEALDILNQSTHPLSEQAENYLRDQE